VQGKTRSSVNFNDLQAFVDIASFLRKSLITYTIAYFILVNLSLKRSTILYNIMNLFIISLKA
jgi:hypothetical protein